MFSLQGVVVTRLDPHEDERGRLTEVFRASWPTGVQPIQWNVVSSAPNVLRGVHVHTKHSDYLTCVAGGLLLGLKDIRRGSPTEGRAEMHLLRPEDGVAVSVPPGVAHGFYFAEPSMLVYSVSEYWSIDDEFGCRWDDPDTGLNWPCTAPVLSPRDRDAGSFADMVREFPTLHGS